MPRKRNDKGGARRLILDPDDPCPTVMAGGVGSVNTSQYTVGGTNVPKAGDKKPSKLPYRVPSMAEIAKVPWNGFNAISTFSGCGGSSLGYRMAGFRMLWASEFIDAARESYLANCSPDTTMDGRDVRDVTPEEVLKAIKLKAGQLDLMDGSPPCASFSTAGKRQAGWGTVKKYSDKVQRTDDLFFEFVRLLRGIRPKTFVAENVSGLVKGTAKGYFLMILKELKDSGYRVTCRVLDAQWLGVPQQRQRTIFVGVREDLKVDPCHPSPLPYRYSVREAIPWIDKVVGTEADNEYNRGRRRGADAHEVVPTVRATQSNQFRVEVSEDTFDEHRTYEDRAAPSIRARKAGHLGVKIVQQQGSVGVGKKEVSPDRPLPTVCGTQAQQFLLSLVEPESDMTGKATGDEWDNVRVGGQSERYFQLVKPALDDSCPTVTAAGGNAGLASVCHPTERRKFSIAELRRICAFPDDFKLTGSYAQQWERLGRAVPPVMMFHVARTVRDEILKKAKR